MKEDYKGLALTSGRTYGGGKVGEIMELQAVLEDEEAMIKVEDGLRKIPIFVASFGQLAWIHSRQAENFSTKQELVSVSFGWPAEENAASHCKKQV